MNKDDINFYGGFEWRNNYGDYFSKKFDYLGYDWVICTVFPHNIFKAAYDTINSPTIYPTSEILEVLQTIPNCSFIEDTYTENTPAEGFIAWTCIRTNFTEKYFSVEEVVEDALSIFSRTFPIIEPVFTKARLKACELYYPEFMEQMKLGQIK